MDAAVGIDQRQQVRVVLDDGEVLPERAQARGRADVRRPVIRLGGSIVVGHGDATDHVSLEAGIAARGAVHGHARSHSTFWYGRRPGLAHSWPVRGTRRAERGAVRLSWWAAR